jgi:hypothetical protein
LNWTQLAPEVSPPGRWGHALAYDSARERVVLLGGRSDSTDRNDTWEWDGETWIERTPEVSPPGRRSHALAYDRARERVVLFGGLFGREYSSPRSVLGDTWEWDGETWVERSPTVSPPGRRGHGLAYDVSRDQTVLIGGYYGCCSSYEVWEWDGSEWTQRIPHFPDWYGRHNITLVYDSDRLRVVFFGGQSEGYYATTFYYDGTWEWDGAGWTWHLPSPRPFPSSGYGLAYDVVHRQVVFLGSGGTWTFGLPETDCDDVDDNDNGLVDEGCDDDGDGYCDSGMPIVGTPVICTHGGDDCNDGDSATHPGAPDLPGDTINQDCHGIPVCDPRRPWSNHGQYVSCVSQECVRLVSEGALSQKECSPLIRDAAQAVVGR